MTTWHDKNNLSHWDDHPQFRFSYYQQDVEEGRTVLGYKEWVTLMIESSKKDWVSETRQAFASDQIASLPGLDEGLQEAIEGEHPMFPVSDWVAEITTDHRGDTRIGYKLWMEVRCEQSIEDGDDYSDAIPKPQ